MKVTLLNHEQLELTEALDNMYNDEYYYKYLNLDRVLSYSTMKWLLKSPKWFAHMKKKGMTETQALRDGKLVHTEILEPEKYGQFTFVDTSSKNTTKWKLAKEQNGAESTYTLKEKYMASRIASAFLQNDACVSFMKGAKTEEPALVEVDGLAVRGKADIFKEGEYVADVKTTNDGLKDVELKNGDVVNQFKFTISKYDYDLQAYLYTQLYDVPDFYWLVIDKTTTDIGVFKASQQTLETGKIKLEAAIAIYKAFFVDELIDLSQYHKGGDFVMTDKQIEHFNYVGALYALSVGVTTDRVFLAEQEAAEINDFSAAIGIRDALRDYNNTDKQFNCYIKLDDYDDSTLD